MGQRSFYQLIEAPVDEDKFPFNYLILKNH